MSVTCTPAEQTSIPLEPRAWRETRWLGSIAGRTTTSDLLAGGVFDAGHRHAVTRIYAAACADLAQATLAGGDRGSVRWERWFDSLRSAAHDLSPARGNEQVVQRALFHGVRLERGTASWAHQLRRGFSALLAASLPEPVVALIGEDLVAFQQADRAWLARPKSADFVSASANPVDSDAGMLRWPTERLRPNPLNPRRNLGSADIDQLAESIAAHASLGGILQPLLVTSDGIVVAGHRRLAAARRVGLAEVPVIVRDLSIVEQLEIQLTENLQRADLSPIEEGLAYAHLLEAGSTLAGIARRVGVPASRVRERLALLDLDERIQEHVHTGELPLNIGLALMPLRDGSRQRRLANHAMRRRLTVSQVRKLVDAALAIPPTMDSPAALPPDDDPDGSGLSTSRQQALDALHAQPDRPITFGQLATLAESICCACGLGSAPRICADCPNLHLLRAVLGGQRHDR
jgi:ParB family chromosome partitioning protein